MATLSLEKLYRDITLIKAAEDGGLKRESMSITGLQSGAFEAKLAEMRKKIADGQNQALAKIDGAVTEGNAKIDAAAEGVKAKVTKEIEDALQEFALTTNGGPA